MKIVLKEIVVNEKAKLICTIFFHNRRLY